MTRRAAIIAFSLVVAVGLLGLRSWDVALGRIQRVVVGAIEERTGIVVGAVERAEIALLPLPRISLSQVGFSRRDGALSGEAVRVRAHLRLLPLLSGRISFDRVDLIAPQIDIVIPAASEGVSEWLAAPLAALERLRSQSKIVISAGSVFLRADGAIRSTVRDLDLVIDERGPGEPLALAGSLNWRGVPTEVSLLWPMAGGSTKAALSATSSLLKLRFEGTRAGPGEPMISGPLALSTPSLTGLLGWFSTQSRLASALGALTLSADIQVKPREVSFNNAVVSLDGDRLDGVVKLAQADGRFALSGTLAGAKLDLGRLVDRLPIPAVDAADPSPLDLDAWTAHDIDLRVSVDAARLEGARLTDVAIYLLVKKGRFETGLIRAGAYGGSLKSRLLASAAPAGVDVKLQAGLDKVNIGQAASDLPQLARLSGIGSLQLVLDGAGRSFDALIGSLTGKVNLALRQGELSGIALGELLRRAERNPAQALRDWRHGKTPFETLTANAGIANGLLVLTEAQMSGQNYRFNLTGSASLSTRILDMAASLSSPNGTPKLPFLLRGPLDAPVFDIAADALLSPAGASPIPLTR
ncbi:AsmA family protein [Bosea sp. (in: a-proteobacteria)]|uniref:AsmA family protein n=1 Tax=Bosea sp. (in: a-proteobacteria) TaxID=1871050 RepID=UPI002604AFEE|nr:AsmA family protein [Bosea sp. (in: a-proteobacteria)]MCO5093420.1 AsmA family protein [Bosea sp. (in: a-proteobacteria)]